jgi:ABC-type branched-subunit amino acid transport system substrate-binding protein
MRSPIRRCILPIRRRILPIRRRILPIAALGLSTAVAGCGAAHSVSIPGVSAGTVTLGSHQPLTGPAAPGYSEISAASQAFFDYVNAHGGVYGRSIHLMTLNDAYNPTNTAEVVNQLVTYDNVFAMFEGVGTSTHRQVVQFLNNNAVPDLFVASGCPCWNDPGIDPYTYGWPPSGLVEGKLLGSYVARHFPGQRVGVLYQDDVAGRAGLAGVRQELAASTVVAQKSYEPGATTLQSQMEAIRAARATVLIDFTLPAYTAIEQLAALRLGFHPHLLVWSGGSDPIIVSRLLKTFSSGQVQGSALIDGAVTDSYLPSASDATNPWVRLFRSINATYDPHTQFDSNVEYGMASAYTFVQALRAAGPNLTRRGLVRAIDREGASWLGPGLLPLQYSRRDHAGFRGAQLGRIENGKLVLFGQPLMTTERPGARIIVYGRGEAVPPRNGIP